MEFDYVMTLAEIKEMTKDESTECKATVMEAQKGLVFQGSARSLNVFSFNIGNATQIPNQSLKSILIM